jgi:hypothetical protein
MNERAPVSCSEPSVASQGGRCFLVHGVSLIVLVLVLVVVLDFLGVANSTPRTTAIQVVVLLMVYL